MARYCFYCGRQLASGEKCTCRAGASSRSTDHGGASGSATTGASGSAAGGGAGHTTGGASGSATTGASSSAAGGASHNTGGAAGQSAGDGTGKRWQNRTSRSAKPGSRPKSQHIPRQRSAPQIKPVLTGFGRLLLYPADQSRYLGRMRRVVYPILALLLNVIASATMLALAWPPGFGSRGFMRFLPGAAAALLYWLILTLCDWLATRFVFHLRFPIRDLLFAQTPAIFYASLFLLAAAISSSSWTGAAMLAASALAASGWARFLTLRDLTGMDENRLIIFLLFVQFLLAGIFGMILGALLPFPVPLLPAIQPTI